MLECLDISQNVEYYWLMFTDERILHESKLVPLSVILAIASNEILEKNT